VLTDFPETYNRSLDSRDLLRLCVFDDFAVFGGTGARPL
jgi:hypothetical protein